MSDLWWALTLVLLVGFGLPGAVWFGIQIGRERERQEWESLYWPGD